jgi:hypothetical protein
VWWAWDGSFDQVSFLFLDHVLGVWHDESVLRAPSSSSPGAVTGAFGAGGDLRRLVTRNGRIMVANRTILDLRFFLVSLVFGVVGFVLDPFVNDGVWDIEIQVRGDPYLVRHVGYRSFVRRPTRVKLADLHSW